ncbi:MAG: mechanosensitive ion channel family protein [Gallionellaceae bacterium]|nr:mechanosensitive ion channel family protein [Gallionellaceae bacterium]
MESILTSLGIHNVELLTRVYQAALHIVIVLLLASLLLRYTGKGIRMLKAYLMERAGDDHEEAKRIDTLGRVFRYLVSVIIILVTGMLVLSEVGISIAPILATAGVLGIAVGFGAQSLVKDYFTGFFLLLEDQVRQGDVVEVAGKGGLVEEVTLRYIKLRNYDGHVHFIPNGAVAAVTNLSRGYAYAVIDVGVAYRENVDEVMGLMHEVGAAMRQDAALAGKILEDLEMAGVDKWADSAVVIRCRFKVQALEQWGIRREYLKRLKQMFDRQGIEIPFPHLTIYPGVDKQGLAPALQVALAER